MNERGRAPRGFTYEPCPGCGATGGRRKDAVCSDCREALDRWGAYKKEREALAAERVYLTKARSYAFPGLSHVYVREDDGDRTDTIRDPLHRLHYLVSRPTDEGFSWQEQAARGWDACVYMADNSRTGAAEWDAVRVFPVAVANALRDLYAGIRDSLRHAYAEGHERGRGLLLSLAAGEITADAFNDAAARLPKPE